MTGVYVLGAGGHGKVVTATLKAMGLEVLSVLDDDSSLWGSVLLGVKIEGPMDLLSDRRARRAVIAVGANSARERIAGRFDEIEWIKAVHPGAFVDSTVRLGPGTVVFAGAVIQPDSTLGSHVIVNTCSSVDHDCRLGDFVHIAPGSHLAGNVSLGRGAFMGTGSCAVPGVAVGPWTTVGAGGTVICDLPGRITAAGVPARPIKKG